MLTGSTKKTRNARVLILPNVICVRVVILECDRPNIFVQPPVLWCARLCKNRLFSSLKQTIFCINHEQFRLLVVLLWDGRDILFRDRPAEPRAQSSRKLKDSASRTAQCQRIAARSSIDCACTRYQNALEDLLSRGFASNFEHEPELAAPANNMYSPSWLSQVWRGEPEHGAHDTNRDTYHRDGHI